MRWLQEKFPSELGDRTAIIRRADLDAKGIYYCAMTGQFASAGEAVGVPWRPIVNERSS